MIEDIRVPINAVPGSCTATVTITGLRWWNLRLDAVLLLFKLAAWIAPPQLKIEIES